MDVISNSTRSSSSSKYQRLKKIAEKEFREFDSLNDEYVRDRNTRETTGRWISGVGTLLTAVGITAATVATAGIGGALGLGAVGGAGALMAGDAYAYSESPVTQDKRQAQLESEEANRACIEAKLEEINDPDVEDCIYEELQPNHDHDLNRPWGQMVLIDNLETFADHRKKDGWQGRLANATNSPIHHSWLLEDVSKSKNPEVLTARYEKISAETYGEERAYYAFADELEQLSADQAH